MADVFVAVCESAGCKFVAHGRTEQLRILNIAAHLREFAHHSNGNTFVVPEHDLDLCECYEQAHSIYVTAEIRYARSELRRLNRLRIEEIAKWDRLIEGAKGKIGTAESIRYRKYPEREYEIGGRTY